MMTKLLVKMSNNKDIFIENVDEVAVNDETYFLLRGKGVEAEVIFSAPLKNVYYIQESK